MSTTETTREVCPKCGTAGCLEDKAADFATVTEDMPEGDTELTEAWAKLEAAFTETTRLADVVEALLPEPGDDDGDED